MKVLRIPVFVLLLTLTLTLFNSVTLSRRCQCWSQQIAAADTAARNESWSDAGKALEQLYSDWLQSQTWLHVVIDHKEIDATEQLLQRCLILSEEHDSAELRASLAELRSQVRLLDEMEQVTIKNIL